MTGCLGDTDMYRLYGDELAVDEKVRVQQHLVSCAACAARERAFVAANDRLCAYLQDLATKSDPLAESQGLPTQPDASGRFVVPSPADEIPSDSLETKTSCHDPARASGEPPTLTKPATGGFARDPIGEMEIPGYVLHREIHRGGQGVVYEATQLSTKRTVALKVTREGPLASPASRDRFQREVELIARLRHPNIVTIHDSGEAGGACYFTMDYIAGEQLDKYVRAHNLSPRRIVELFATIGDAISAAHQRGIIHRDLKPSNIMVDEAGEPHILDFGLARLAVEEAAKDPDYQEISRAGFIMGTLPYMSPEQTRGDLAAVDVRTDVYSLGVALFEMLTGQRPYATDGTDLMDALHNIREAVPPRAASINRAIHADVDAIVHKALEKDPRNRYQSSAEFVHDLCAWLEGRPVLARSASSLYVIRRTVAQHKIPALIAISFLITAISMLSIATEGFVRATLAARDEQTAERNSIQANRAASRYAQAHARALRLMALDGFLDTWSAGNDAQADALRTRLPSASPERALADYLSTCSHNIEAPDPPLPMTEPVWLDLAHAEFSLRRGETDAGRFALDQAYTHAEGDLVLRAYLGQRLSEIAGAKIPPPPDTGGATGEDKP